LAELRAPEGGSGCAAHTSKPHEVAKQFKILVLKLICTDVTG
jgi:hypothetical protein